MLEASTFWIGPSTIGSDALGLVASDGSLLSGEFATWTELSGSATVDSGRLFAFSEGSAGMSSGLRAKIVILKLARMTATHQLSL